MMDGLCWSIFSRTRLRIKLSKRNPQSLSVHLRPESHPTVAVTLVTLLHPQPWLPLLCAGAPETEPATDRSLWQFQEDFASV